MEHRPIDHAPVLITWPTSFFHYAIAEDPDMTAVVRLLGAGRDACPPCIQYWANASAESDPLAIIHLLGIAWAWATKQTGLGLEDLSSGPDPVFRKESAEWISLILEDRISDIIRAAKVTPKMNLLEIIDDSTAAATIRRIDSE